MATRDPPPASGIPPMPDEIHAESGRGGVSQRETRWEAAVQEALDRRIAQTGITIAPGERDELIAALMQVRKASRATQRTRASDHVSQAMQSQTLAKADLLFREKLGLRISEFIAGESAPGQIEDLGKRPQ